MRTHSPKTLPNGVGFPSAKNVTGLTMQREYDMTVDERRKYMRLEAPRYAKASRAERSGVAR